VHFWASSQRIVFAGSLVYLYELLLITGDVHEALGAKRVDRGASTSRH